MESEILSKVLDSLKTKVSDFNYKNWFQNLSWEYQEPHHVIVKVPSKFVRDWLSDHYLELIKFELFRYTEQEHTITFKIQKYVERNLELFPKDGATSVINPLAQSLSGQVQTTTAVAARPKSIPYGFNPKYSFENFVVGNSNQFVHAACKAVALQPAKSYNPLFIYGGVGLGKTHLLNAIGLEIIKNYPQWKVIYVTGEQFTNEVINAIRYDKTYDFRKKYRDQCDVLLIDDIQFIAGKERTMEEFFHTFNALYESRKQIILTSDQYPKNIDRLEERLQSRFSWGLLADIQTPDYETRIAILRKKAEEEKVPVADDVCEYIAQSITSHVRDLEGALIRVCAFASLAKVPVTIGLAREVLKDMVQDYVGQLSVELIQTRVAEYFQLKMTDLKSKRRYKHLAVPRQIAMYLCKKHLEVSFPVLGQKFGGKDHTTVMHAVQKIQKHRELDAVMKNDLSELEKILKI